MAKIYNRNPERAIVHSVVVDGVKVPLILKPGKVTEVPDGVIAELKKALSETQFADLIAGDEDIAAARASHAALLNQEKAKSAELAGENATLRAQVEAMEKTLLELKAKAKVK